MCSKTCYNKFCYTISNSCTAVRLKCELTIGLQKIFNSADGHWDSEAVGQWSVGFSQRHRIVKSRFEIEHFVETFFLMQLWDCNRKTTSFSDSQIPCTATRLMYTWTNIYNINFRLAFAKPLLQGAANKSSPLTFFAVFSATAWNLNAKFYAHI